MKIVLSSKSSFWNLDMPVIQEYIDEVIYINYVWDAKNAKQITPIQFNIEEYVCCGSPNPGYDSGDYRTAVNEVDNFVKLLKKGEDVVFLCDTSYASMYMFRAMYEKVSDYNIHLVLIHRNSGDEHNAFFGDYIGDKRQMQNKLLFVKGLKSVVSIPEGRVQEVDVNELLEEVMNQILFMREEKTYVYDHCINEYVAKKITMGAIEESERGMPQSKNIEILAGVPCPIDLIPSRLECDYDTPRPDGKKVCAILKKIRRTLVEANDLDVVIEECDFQGDCAGSCPRCEEELRMIEKLMLNIPEEDRIYPSIDIKDEMAKHGEEI